MRCVTVQSRPLEKNRILLFHWRGGYLTKEVLKELLVVFDEEASVKRKTGVCIGQLATGSDPV